MPHADAQHVRERRLDMADHLVLLRRVDAARLSRLLARELVGRRDGGGGRGASAARVCRRARVRPSVLVAAAAAGRRRRRRRQCVGALQVRVGVLKVLRLVKAGRGGVRVDENLRLAQRAAELLEEVHRQAREALACHARVRREQPQHHCRRRAQRESSGGHADGRVRLWVLVVEHHRGGLDVPDHLLARNAAREREVVHVAIELERLQLVRLALRDAQFERAQRVKHVGEHADRLARLRVAAVRIVVQPAEFEPDALVRR
mmetsp:Transcript_34646/g.103515  ORF Transcript_34646/g.103515 Transcript_34646/m.103515 type:complete len:261 (-) Transcript_34646:182-964(-)